jgi:hypothetical protein
MFNGPKTKNGPNPRSRVNRALFGAVSAQREEKLGRMSWEENQRDVGFIVQEIEL